MRRALLQAVALLDEGVRLYRRHFNLFTALAFIFSLPVLLLIFNLLFQANDADPLAEVDAVALAILSLAIAPLLIIPPLARTTRLVLDGQQPSLRQVIFRWPNIGRGIVILIYSGLLVFGWSMLVATSGLVTIGFGCTMLGFLLIFTIAGGPISEVLAPAIVLGIGSVYLFSLVICGAGLLAALYCVQPLLDERVSLSRAFAFSFELIIDRFGYNVLVFVCAAMLFSVIALVVTVTVGVALPVPFGFFLGPEHPLVRGLGGVAWVFGLALSMPLIPIWSTLHYRQVLDARSGVDLRRRLQALQASVTAGAR